MTDVQMVLDLEGGKYGPWVLTHRFDKDVAQLLDRHYSRVKVGSPQVGRPGHNLILRNLDCTACWISWRGIRDDGLEDVWECTAYRSESSEMLSSEMINWAVYATICEWGHRFPAKGMITYVDAKSVKSVNPGYCYKKAGFRQIGVSKKRKLLLFYHALNENYLAAERVADALKESQRAIEIALESGEWYYAVYFQKEAMDQEGWLDHLNGMLHSGKLVAWEGLVPTMFLEDLAEIISPFEGLNECIY